MEELNKYFQNNFSKTEKRKFIMDIADCNDHNQKQIIKKFIKLIDDYSEKKTDILKKIDADNFGSLEEVSSNISLEDELESLLKYDTKYKITKGGLRISEPYQR